MAKQEYEAPDDDAVEDMRLYWRLQREAQAREDRAAYEQRERDREREQAAMHPQPPPEPRYVNGRWVIL